jgi:hypothetical protein
VSKPCASRPPTGQQFARQDHRHSIDSCNNLHLKKNKTLHSHSIKGKADSAFRFQRNICVRVRLCGNPFPSLGKVRDAGLRSLAPLLSRTGRAALFLSPIPFPFSLSRHLHLSLPSQWQPFRVENLECQPTISAICREV